MPSHRSGRCRCSTAAARSAIAICLVLLAGCWGGKREPVYAEPMLAQRGLHTLQLMPVVDTRADPFDAVIIANHLRAASKRVLEGKGYAVSIEPVSSPERSVSAGDIARMNTRQLAELAPPEQQYLVFLYIDMLERGYETRGEWSRVRVRGVIIDAQEKAAIWRDKASAESSLTGMLTVLSGPGTDYEALFSAARSLFSTLPGRAG